MTAHDPVGRGHRTIDLSGINHPPHGLGDRKTGILLVVDASEQGGLLLRTEPVPVGPITVGDDDARAFFPSAVPVPGLVRESKQDAGHADPITRQAQGCDHSEEDVPSPGFFSHSGRPGSGSSK